MAADSRFYSQCALLGKSTKVSPFFARFAVEPLLLKAVSSKAGNEVQAADEFADKMKSTHEQLKVEIIYAQSQYERFGSNRIPSSAYKVGDKAWLNARNIHTDRPSKKLD